MIYVTFTNHAKQQIKKRTDKTEKEVNKLFRDILKAYKKKELYEGFKPVQYIVPNEYGTANKLICGPYGFLYCITHNGFKEYLIITYINKNAGVTINGNHYNTNN